MQGGAGHNLVWHGLARRGLALPVGLNPRRPQFGHVSYDGRVGVVGVGACRVRALSKWVFPFSPGPPIAILQTWGDSCLYLPTPGSQRRSTVIGNAWFMPPNARVGLYFPPAGADDLGLTKAHPRIACQQRTHAPVVAQARNTETRDVAQARLSARRPGRARAGGAGRSWQHCYRYRQIAH